MQSPSKYWREAATLILVGRSSRLNSQSKPDVPETTHSSHHTQKHSANGSMHFDYKTLMLKRSNQSSFFAGMSVFPGGTVDRVDFTKDWEPIFKKVASKSVSDIAKELNINGPRPPMITAIRSDFLPADLGFRICAIRETFEESGILLVTKTHLGDNRNNVFHINDHNIWREKVQKDASQFLELCKNFEVVPNLWALNEWSNWLTPVMKQVREPPAKPRRFDTLFYLCSLDNTHQAQHDKQEITNVEWVTPAEVLDPKSNVKAIGPQLFECSRLANFRTLDSLDKYAHQRGTLGTIRWLNVYILCTDGYVALMPGDDLYPEFPDLDGTSPPREVNMTISKLRKTTTNCHRQERYNDDTQIFVCNVDLECGQVRPYDLQGEMKVLHRDSKL